MNRKLSHRQALLNALPHWFLSFLIKEKALSKYVSNTLEYISSDRYLPDDACPTEERVDKRMFIFNSTLAESTNIVNKSMQWGLTPEGQKYWVDLYWKETHLRQTLKLSPFTP